MREGEREREDVRKQMMEEFKLSQIQTVLKAGRDFVPEQFWAKVKFWPNFNILCVQHFKKRRMFFLQYSSHLDGFE